MNIKYLQEEVHKWASQFKEPYWPPLSQLARLQEETGELARILNITYGSKVKKEGEELSDPGEELADIIITVCCIANNLKIDLTETTEKAVNKLHKRDTANISKAEEENA